MPFFENHHNFSLISLCSYLVFILLSLGDFSIEHKLIFNICCQLYLADEQI